MTDQSDSIDDVDPSGPQATDIDWKIRRAGRAWRGKEAHERYQLTPDKFEMIDGKLFWDEGDRLMLLGLLLENVGVDRAVQLGDPRVWRAAVASLEDR